MAAPLGFTDAGEGAPLLAVHGALTSGRLTFGSIADRWSDLCRLVMVDRPGFQLTPGPAEPLVDQAERLAATAHLVGAGEPVDAIGCSLGGLVLLRAVQMHPHRFRSLVIVEAAAIDLCPPDMVLAEELVQISRDAHHVADTDLSGAFDQAFARVDPSMWTALELLRRSGDPGVTMLRGDLAIWEARLDRHRLAQAVAGPRPIPVLVVSGTRSHDAFRTFGRSTAAALYGRHHVIEGAGHAAHLHPDFTPVLSQFLAELNEQGHRPDTASVAAGEV